MDYIHRAVCHRSPMPCVSRHASRLRRLLHPSTLYYIVLGIVVICTRMSWHSQPLKNAGPNASLRPRHQKEHDNQRDKRMAVRPGIAIWAVASVNCSCRTCCRHFW